ncbi:MAG TPA: hypothetical protein VFU31_25290 [Candidatus Binatia bacterium]|nr:hypothetical protein [Candidatus Binatia bacterium]
MTGSWNTLSRPGSLLLVLVVALVCHTAGEASYVIKLKNGREIVTGRYWPEGQQVMFDTYGGVFGVDRALVSKIEHSDRPLKEPAPLKPRQPKTPSVPVADQKEKGQSPVATAKTRAARETDPIFKDFETLKQRSQTVAGMSNSQLQEFLKALTALRRTIQASGRSNDYLREFAEISEMGDAAEAQLRSRR